MINLKFESLEEAYPQLLKTLLEEGKEVSPRGILTKEIAPLSITISNPRKRVISSKARKLNYGFMVGELLWMLVGSNKLDHVSHYNKQWVNFSDDNVTLNGAYGQRIFKWDGLFDVYQSTNIDEEGNEHPSFELEHIVMDQFQLAYEQLKTDPYSRQATISLFNPVQDYTNTKDKPCTNLIRFMIRDNKLNMTVFMRSNDCIFGFPYDTFNFTMMQEIMAGKLNVEVGKYTHIADSFHIYENHFSLAEEIIKEDYKSIYTSELVDGRISEDNLPLEFEKIFNIESLTRLTGNIVKLEKIEELLNEIENEYWRSLIAVVATYNFRKFGRDQSELDKLKTYITNEFSRIDTIKNWKPLSR